MFIQFSKFYEFFFSINCPRGKKRSPYNNPTEVKNSTPNSYYYPYYLPART